MALPLQSLQGKYEILERLQEGGMGAIYKVRHRLLGEVRVIKLIRPHLESDPTLAARFLREAQAAARLSHPNIARVYDYSVDDDGAAYIVMEFIKGLTLSELMTPVGRTPEGGSGELLPLALVVEIARQSLAAIAHVHSHGIVHRDISPDNLMLSRDLDGRPLVKLIDLGLVKTVEGTSKLTAAGVFVGKFRYAAPEQFEDAFEGDRRRGDLYSFGVVLYELLTGRYPIVGNSPSSLIAGHLFRPPLPFGKSDPDGRVPDKLRRAVLTSLAKHPSERFDSADSFAEALADERWDLDAPDVRSVVESTQKIVRPVLPALPPGSTQSRLDRQFLAEPTPAPDEATVALSPVPSVPAPRRQRRAARRSAEAEIHDLVGRGDVEAAAERLPEALEVAGPTLVLRNLRDQIDRQLEAGSAAGADRDRSRRRRADELVAAARDRAGAEGFAAAAELLRQALNLVPGHAEALALRASVEVCLEVRAEEIRQAEEVERTATEIRALLADGDLAAAQADVDRALERFGERDDLRAVEHEITGVRQAAEDRPGRPDPNAPTVVLGARAPATAGEDPAAAESDEVAEMTASIRQLQSRGEHGRALETLQHAVAAHGTLDVFKELRYELGQAMLDRAAEEDDTGSRILDTLPAEQRRGGRAELDDLPLGPAAERSPSAPAFDATSARPPMPPARRGGGRGGWKLTLALVLVVLVGLLLGVLLGQLGEPRPAETAAAPAEEVAAPAPGPGFVVLDALPWAEITAIVAIPEPSPEAVETADEEVAITPSRYTPVVLELPPGRYRLSLSHPPSGGTEELEIEVESGVRRERRLTFAELDGKRYFDQVGW